MCNGHTGMHAGVGCDAVFMSSHGAAAIQSHTCHVSLSNKL
jgi:hypothetical protein